MKLDHGSQTRVYFKKVYIHKNGREDLRDAVKKVPKMENVDYAIELERNTINFLRRCGVPHVVKIYDVIREKPDPKKLRIAKRSDQESDRESDDDIDNEFDEQEILYTQYSGKVVSKYMHKPISYDEAMSIIASILVSCISMNGLKCSHNDLHSDNVTIKTVAHDYRRYIFSDESTLTVKSFGKQPCIIDFGFAYCDTSTTDDEECKLYTPPHFTNCGIFPWWHDPLSDKIKFLKSIVRIIKLWQIHEGVYDKVVIDPRFLVLKWKIIQTYISKYLKCYLDAHLYLITKYLHDVYMTRNPKDDTMRKIITVFENEILEKEIKPGNVVSILNQANDLLYRKGSIRNRNQFSIKDGRIVLKSKCTFTIKIYEEDLQRLNKIIEIEGIERSYTDRLVKKHVDVCYQSVKFENLAIKLLQELKPCRSQLFTGKFALDALALFINQLKIREIHVDENTQHSGQEFYSLAVLFEIFESYWVECCEMQTSNTIDRLICLKRFLDNRDEIPQDQLSDMDHAVRLLLYEMKRYVVDKGVVMYKRKVELQSRVKDDDFIRFVFSEANVPDSSIESKINVNYYNIMM